jgi:hypothetical protein
MSTLFSADVTQLQPCNHWCAFCLIHEAVSLWRTGLGLLSHHYLHTPPGTQ